MDEVELERFYELLFWQLMQRLPQPKGIHIYSKGNLIKGVTKTKVSNDEYIIKISNGINYGNYVLGYKDDGSRRQPRTYLESVNFRIVDECVETVSKILKGKGKVFVNGQVYQ